MIFWDLRKTSTVVAEHLALSPESNEGMLFMYIKCQLDDTNILYARIVCATVEVQLWNFKLDNCAILH